MRSQAAKCYLNCGLANTRSLGNSCALVEDHIVYNNLDVFVITETWLTSVDGNDILHAACPAGYSALHIPRIGRRGGGVALIYCSSIVLMKITLVHVPVSFEYLAVALTVNSSLITLVVVYRPPASNFGLFIEEFSTLLEILSTYPGRILIVGDFNIHVDDPLNPAAAKFLCLIESFDLLQHVSGSTHASGHTLDLVLSLSSDDSVADCYTSDPLSDHSVVHWVVRAHRPCRPFKPVSFRKLKSIDMDSFSADILDLPLFQAPSDDLEGLLLQYNTGLATVLDAHAPMVYRSFAVRPDNPWCSEEILAARRRLRRLERLWRRTGLHVHYEMFNDACLSRNKLIHEAKSTFLVSRINENLEKKSLFKVVDSFLIKKPQLALPNHDSLPELAERFSAFFTEKVNNIRVALEVLTCNVVRDFAPYRGNSFSVFKPVSVSEILVLIKSCPCKSSLRDPVPSFLVKAAADLLAPPIAALINRSLELGIFPAEMKLAFISPLLKKLGLDPDVLGNYRPVSALSFISKLLERVVAKQLIEHLETQSLYVPVQSAYRSFHSTETALLKVLNDILSSIDHGDSVILALLDQSAAFDLIDHEILLNRLSTQFGVTGVPLCWFESYLSGRLQSVCIKGVCSSPVPLQYGVPQGSVLGPVLFTLYISHLHEIANSFNLSDHYYADDVQLYQSFRANEKNAVYSTLSAAISEIKCWLSQNFLKLNEEKTDVILLSSASSKHPPEGTSLDVGGALVPISDGVRDLGVIFDPHLTMAPHIRSSCKKAYFHLRRIARIRKFLPRLAVKQLVHAFVISQLDYGNSLLAGLPDVRLDGLRRVQNSAARLITGARKFESITPHLRSLHWLPIRQRIDFKIAVLVHRCLHGSAPSYLAELIIPYCPPRALRSASLYQLSVPASRLKSYGNRAFSVFAPRLWNSLPLSIRSAQSLGQFRSLLKTHLFSTAFSN